MWKCNDAGVLYRCTVQGCNPIAVCCTTCIQFSASTPCTIPVFCLFQMHSPTVLSVCTSCTIHCSACTGRTIHCSACTRRTIPSSVCTAGIIPVSCLYHIHRSNGMPVPHQPPQCQWYACTTCTIQVFCLCIIPLFCLYYSTCIVPLFCLYVPHAPSQS
jgi:hypothetical protein